LSEVLAAMTTKASDKAGTSRTYTGAAMDSGT